MPTFCGGRVITSIRPDLSTYPINNYREKWSKLSKTNKLRIWEETKVLVYKDLAHFTKKLQDPSNSLGKYYWEGAEEDAEWIFDQETLEGEGVIHKEDMVLVPRSYVDIGLSRAIFFISDAINGENNSPYSITTYDLAMSSPEWKPVLQEPVPNPNSFRPVNSWTLKAKTTKSVQREFQKREQGQRKGWADDASEYFLEHGVW